MKKTPNRNSNIFISIVITLLLIILSSSCQPPEKEDWIINRVSTFGNNPAFSPNGEFILFGGDDGQTQGLWIYTLSTSETSLLYQGAFNYDYVWENSSDKIAFSEPGGNFRKLWMLDLQGDTTLLASDGRNPTWSPDGAEIAFQSGTGTLLYKKAIADTASAQLIVSEGQYPQWSPDGENIAYITGTGSEFFIHLWNCSNGTSADLISGGTTFNWSPDGTAIVFDTFELVSANSYYLNIKKTAISSPAGILLWTGGVNPKWSADGNFIVFESLSGYSNDGLVIINSAGGAAELITDNGYLPSINPDASLIAFARSDNGIWLARRN